MKLAMIILAGISLLFLFTSFNPEVNSFFPKCPFLLATGFECPGCGSQRAIHDLLNVNLAAAFRHNPLLVISIPYLVILLLIGNLQSQNGVLLKIRRLLMSQKAILLVLFVILAFWVGRNII